MMIHVDKADITAASSLISFGLLEVQKYNYYYSLMVSSDLFILIPIEQPYLAR